MKIYTTNEYNIFDAIEEDNRLLQQNVYDNGKSPILKMIIESMGIVDNYFSIVNEIYDAISNEKPIPNDPSLSYLVYVLNNYTLKQDCFIESVTVRVLSGKKGPKYHGSTVKTDYNDININSDGKLVNVLFTIGIPTNSIQDLNGKNVFYQEMAHEIQHIFRYYSICMNNNGAIENEKKKRNRYGDLIKKLIKQDGGSIEKSMVSLSYALNGDELMSECNRLYEFIRQNENINSNTFENYLDEMPLYWRLDSCIKELSFLDDIMYGGDKGEVEKIGQIYKSIMKLDNISDEKAFMKYRFTIIGKEEKIRKLFYRTLNKAFDDFERKIPNSNVFEILKQNKDFELLKEILNKC